MNTLTRSRLKLLTRRTSPFLALTIAGLLQMAATVSLPAMYQKLTLEQIIQQSDGICVASVVNQSVRPGNNKMIWTDVDLVISEWVGGRMTRPADNRLTVSLAGGAWDGKVLEVSDVPTLRTGQTYLVMLKLDGGPYLSPFVGGFQGLFKVISEQAGARSYALTLGDRYVAGVKDGDTVLGPPALSISGRVPTLKPLELRTRRITEAPQAVAGSGAVPANGGVAASKEPPAAMTLDEFITVIKGQLAKAN